MPLEARLVIGLATALAVVHLTTPLAIRVAQRYEFYDKPIGYKGHAAPTPYLGGAAVVAGFLVAIVMLGGDWDRSLPLIAGVLVLWVVGTIDDRWTVSPSARIVVETGLATGLWALGLGWELGAGAVVDLAVSVIWIVAVVNAFNLFDNMDGAASSMAAVVAGGLALLGVVQGDTWLAVTAAALCGAAVGFLPHNLLASPARIFLGDGGSMPVGFAVAAVTMIGVSTAAPAWQSLAMGLLFVGIPALDTTLVMVSRRRRGVSILTAGRDHLTHRTRQRFETARAVAVALGGAQAVISALAVVALSGGSSAIVIAVIAYLVGLGVAIVLLDSRSAPAPVTAMPAVALAARPRTDLPAALLLIALAAGIAISPFFFGYYDAGIWAPAGMGLLGVATAGLIARPPRFGVAAVLLLSGIVGTGLWALVSSTWADSIERAVVDGNRWLAYAALAVVLLVLIRSDRLALLLLAALAIGCVGVGASVVIRMLGSDPGDLFLGGRLNAPLGYINGVGSFFLLGLWLCVAAAERRHAAIAAGGAGGATLLAGLLLLTQSRGVALAAALSALVVLAFVPGRVRRGWALVLIAGAVGVAAPALLDVYVPGATSVPVEVAHDAAWQLALAAVLAGGVWGAAVWIAGRDDRPGLRRAAAATLIAGLVAAAGVGLVSAGRIADTLDRQYTSFVRLAVEPQGSAAQPSSRLVSGAGNRYDYWRVAWGAWKERPLGGVGAGNYDRVYFARRATTEDVTQPHSIPLQLLSELGLVGAALLALAFAGIALGARRVIAASRHSPDSRTIAAASIGMLAAWLLHTSVDWIHLLPGVTAIAIVAATCLVRRPEHAIARARPRVARWLPALAVALVVTVAAVSLSRQALSGHFESEARAALAQDPAAALREADRALRLDSEAIGAYYAKSAAFARFNEPDAAKAALAEAARREPGNYVTWALLGDLAVRTGDLADAKRLYGRALALNPRDPSLQALADDPRSAMADS